VVGSDADGQALARRVEGLGSIDVVPFDNRGARVT
jgi:hypothetical protein